MSGKKPRAVKPKAAKKDVAEPAPAPAPAPAPVPVPAPVAAPVAVPAPTPAAAPTPSIIITATSRVTTNINTQGINALAKARHNELDEKIKAFEYAKAALAAGKVSDTREVDKTENGATTKVKESYERAITADEKASFTKTVAENEKSIASMKADSHAFGQACMRFAKNAAPAVSIAIDQTVKQLVTHAMQNGDSKGRKNIEMEHLYAPGLEKLPLAPLVLSLPTSVEVRTRLEREQREHNDKIAKEVLLKNQEKELKKTYGIKKKDVAAHAAKEAVAAPAPAAAPAAKDDEEDAEANLSVDRKTSFDHYVREICKQVSTQSFADKKLRVSGELRKHIAALMKEFCQRLNPMLAEAVRYDDSKTVQVDTVLFVLKLLLIDGHAPVETLELKNVDVPNPDALKKEQEKKAAEKKAGRSYKIDLSKIPTTIGRQAVHTVTYPTSGYPDLESLIKTKLAELEAEESAKKPVEAK